MKRVYLVRHGETTYNQEGLVQDGSSLLTDLGKKQAYKVAERLGNLSFDHLVVSDYERTKQTAMPIAEATKKTPEYSELFREIRRPSSFFHKPRANDDFQDFLTESEMRYGESSWHHSDEENFADGLIRVEKALNFLLQQEGDVAVVSHGHFIRLITAYILIQKKLTAEVWQLMMHSFWTTNTGITALSYENETWRLITFNDHAHFAE